MSSQSITNPLVRISQADLASGQVLNEKLVKATQAGFFYLEMSDACKGLVGKAVSLPIPFHQKRIYRASA